LRLQIPLQKRKILKQNLKGIAFAVGIWGALTCVAWILLHFGILHLRPENQSSVILRWSAVLGLLLIWKLGYPILYFMTYFYDIEGENLVIKKGVVASREITLPFSRITDVY